MYYLIHPTKCGGTAFFDFLKQYYGDNFEIYGCHSLKCSDVQNPIIIVRDPYERFLSMYYYWKNGSEKNQNIIYKKKRRHYTIDHFIYFLKNNSIQNLYNDFIWNVHFLPFSNWIDESSYSKSIVIIYSSLHLNSRCNELLDFLNIINKNLILPKVNVSFKDKKIILTENQKIFVRDMYKNDFNLLQNIKDNPQLFKKIIGS